jgi:hypothetical protein
MQLNFKPSKNLTKVTINAKFPTKKTLPYWLKVTQISFDPSSLDPSKTQDVIILENASKLVIILDFTDIRNYKQNFDLSQVAKLKNLESLYFVWDWAARDFEFLKPLLKTLQSNCPKISSLKIDLNNSPEDDISILIGLLQEHLPQISSVDIHDCNDVEVPIHMIGQMFEFKNLKKMALSIISPSHLPSLTHNIQYKYLTDVEADIFVDDTTGATCQGIVKDVFPNILEN